MLLNTARISCAATQHRGAQTPGQGSRRGAARSPIPRTDGRSRRSCRSDHYGNGCSDRYGGATSSRRRCRWAPRRRPPLGDDGVTLLADNQGTYLGAGSRDQLRQVLDDRSAVAPIHPADLPAPAVENVLVPGGIVRRHPNIRFILGQAGGFVPYASHRMAVAIASDTDAARWTSCAASTSPPRRPPARPPCPPCSPSPAPATSSSAATGPSPPLPPGSTSRTAPESSPAPAGSPPSARAGPPDGARHGSCSGSSDRAPGEGGALSGATAAAGAVLGRGPRPSRGVGVRCRARTPGPPGGAGHHRGRRRERAGCPSSGG